MTKTLLASLVSLALVAFSGGANAVDITNLDKDVHDVLINDPEAPGEVFIEIYPGDTLNDICGSCEITLGDAKPISASDDEVVSIKNGILEIKLY